MLYTYLVKTGKMTLETLIDRMAIAPRRVFGLEGGALEEGQIADFSVWDLETRSKIDPETFFSKGRSTPFAGMEAAGENRMTFVNGKIVYRK